MKGKLTQFINLPIFLVERIEEMQDAKKAYQKRVRTMAEINEVYGKNFTDPLDAEMFLSGLNTHAAKYRTC